MSQLAREIMEYLSAQTYSPSNRSLMELLLPEDELFVSTILGITSPLPKITNKSGKPKQKSETVCTQATQDLIAKEE